MPLSPESAKAMLGYFKKMEIINPLPVEGYQHIDYFSDEELERCDRLDAIPRYSAIKEMTHRGSVGSHVIRVTVLTMFGTDMLLNLGYELDQPRAVLYADHHDDTEIPDMEDIPSPVKRKAKGKKKKELQKREREAVQEVEHLVAKPTWIGSYKELYEDYKRQDTIEAILVNFMDKWDGLHEAVHEVICGDNKDEFRRVVEEYRPVFEDLNLANGLWHQAAGTYLGADLFSFPEPDKLISRKPQDLDWSSAQNLIKSAADGNPKSYMFWLMASQHAFKFHFLSRIFPGWIEHVPEKVWEDIDRITKSNPYKTTESGLLVPSTQIDPGNPTFGESLTFEILRMIIDGRGEKIRQELGFLKRARGKYHNVKQYLDE